MATKLEKKKTEIKNKLIESSSDGKIKNLGTKPKSQIVEEQLPLEKPITKLEPNSIPTISGAISQNSGLNKVANPQPSSSLQKTKTLSPTLSKQKSIIEFGPNEWNTPKLESTQAQKILQQIKHNKPIQR